MATSVDAKLLKQTKFPPEFNQKVDMQKVNVEVMKKWIAGKISEILGTEDDVVIELCFNLLEGARFPNIKVLQIQLTGFLDKDTAKFCKELWSLCLSAQDNPQGVPKELLEAKKLELIQEKIDAEKAAEAARLRQEHEKLRERNMANIRQRERGERGRGRGRGDRKSSDYDRRQPRYSWSPPSRHRDSPERPLYRDPPQRPRVTDTYIPNGHGVRRGDDQRRRSPSRKRSISDSRTRSPSPARRRRYSLSRSPPPIRRRSHGRGWRTSDHGDDRARTLTPLETSRSRSPRRNHKGRLRSITRSPNPRPRSGRHRHRHRHTSSSISQISSRSPSGERRRSGNARRSPSYATNEEKWVETRADYRKGRRFHNDWRRSPKRSRSPVHPRRSAPREPNRSISPDRRQERKRHRSIERYAPAARRPRNTSSLSPPADKRRKTVDSTEEETSSKRASSDERPAVAIRGHGEVRSTKLTATELQEKLLREKVKALRKSSTSAIEQPINAA